MMGNSSLPVMPRKRFLDRSYTAAKSGKPSISVPALQKAWGRVRSTSQLMPVFHALVWYAARDAMLPVMQFLTDSIRDTPPQTEARNNLVAALVKTARDGLSKNPDAAVGYLRIAANELHADERAQTNLRDAANRLQLHRPVIHAQKPLPRNFHPSRLNPKNRTR